MDSKKGTFMAEHENKLAAKLELALNHFIAGASNAVIPPGTLGLGMGFKQSNSSSRNYDESIEVITVTGTVTIEIYRTHRAD